ncbi:MAG: SEL1-like repeat protein [Candidatus Sericytochromatia bacterium]|nr:SEL1-like repeat protein [Candidatus Sericytochromatia bacterium]
MANINGVLTNTDSDQRQTQLLTYLKAALAHSEPQAMAYTCLEEEAALKALFPDGQTRAPLCKQGLSELEKQAEKGDPYAQILLGMVSAFADEAIVPALKDAPKARYWLTKPEAQTLPMGQFMLAGLYHRGVGGAPDFAKAEALYQSLGEQGYAFAYQTLAALLKDQEKPDLAKNAALAAVKLYASQKKWKSLIEFTDYLYFWQYFTIAFEAYTLAAESGNTFAMAMIGELLIEGLGMPADLEQGKRWLDKAMSLQEPEAYFFRGRMFLMEIGEKKDPNQALIHFIKAAELNQNLGVHYAQMAYGQGGGIPSDYLNLFNLRKQLFPSIPEPTQAERLLPFVVARGYTAGVQDLLSKGARDLFPAFEASLSLPQPQIALLLFRKLSPSQQSQGLYSASNNAPLPLFSQLFQLCKPDLQLRSDLRLNLIQRERLDHFKWLVSQETQKNWKFQERLALLSQAIKSNNINTFLTLESIGIKLDKKDLNMWFEVAEKGNPELLRYFKSKGFGLNQTDAFGNAALHRAFRAGNRDNVLQLVSLGANPKSVNKQGDLPFMLLKDQELTLLKASLLEKPVLIDLKAQNAQGMSLLHQVLQLGNYESAQLLIQNGAPLQLKDKLKRTPLDLIQLQLKRFLPNQNLKLVTVQDSLKALNALQLDHEKFEHAVSQNMSELQTMLETYAVDHEGNYPPDFQTLYQAANLESAKYWKELSHPLSGKKNHLDLFLLQKDYSGNEKQAGFVLYSPLKQVAGKIKTYEIRGVNRLGGSLKKSGKILTLKSE